MKIDGRMPCGTISAFEKKYGYHPLRADGSMAKPYVAGFLEGRLTGMKLDFYHHKDGLERVLDLARNTGVFIMLRDESIVGGPAVKEDDGFFEVEEQPKQPEKRANIFKVGDKVIHIDAKDRWGAVGETGTIIGLCPEYHKRGWPAVRIKYDDKNGLSLRIFEDNLKLRGKWTNATRLGVCLNCKKEWGGHFGDDCMSPNQKARAEQNEKIAAKETATEIMRREEAEYRYKMECERERRMEMRKEFLNRPYSIPEEVKKAFTVTPTWESGENNRCPTGSRRFLLL